MAGAGSRTVVRFAVWRAEVDGAERCGGVVDVQVGKCLGRDKGELFATSVSREAVWVQNISEQSDGGWQADARICASGVGVSAPGSSLLQRKFVEKKLTDVVTLHVGTRIKLGISIATVSFIGNATDASLPHDGGMMDEGEDGDEDEGEDTVAATQANSPSDEARGSAVGRMARFSGAEQGGASSVSKKTKERVNQPLPTPRRNKGDKAAQNKRRRERQAAERHAARKRDPVAAAQAAAAAAGAGREAKLKARAQAAIAVGDLALARRLLAQLEKQKGGGAHQKRSKKRGRGAPKQPHPTDKARRKRQKNKGKKAQQRREREGNGSGSGRQQRRSGGRGRPGQSQRRHGAGAVERKRKQASRNGHARNERKSDGNSGGLSDMFAKAAEKI